MTSYVRSAPVDWSTPAVNWRYWKDAATAAAAAAAAAAVVAVVQCTVRMIDSLLTICMRFKMQTSDVLLRKKYRFIFFKCRQLIPVVVSIDGHCPFLVDYHYGE